MPTPAELFTMQPCPVCREDHERGPDGWVGPHTCPEFVFVNPAIAVAGQPWCSTCQTECARMRPPPCITPGCASPAATMFTVNEPGGRLAGRDWVAGDSIELCWPHADDVFNTVGKTDPADVAPWLRPDAADPPNTWQPWRVNTPYGPPR
jgi:hypothetical protein